MLKSPEDKAIACDPEKCFTCETGRYIEVIVSDYIHGKIIIKDVRILRCTNCGEEIIPPDSGRKIDKIVYG